jgi:hypothetical protein
MINVITAAFAHKYPGLQISTNVLKMHKVLLRALTHCMPTRVLTVKHQVVRSTPIICPERCCGQAFLDEFRP